MNPGLVRAMFPRWSFFDRVGAEIMLDVKEFGASDWQPIYFHAARTMGGLFINPDVTRFHAEVSLLENFTQDILRLADGEGKVESSSVTSLTSFKMIRSLVMSRLMVESTGDIQFRISAKSEDQLNVVYISDVLRATP